MALTGDDVAYFESELGAPLDEADVDGRLTRLGSRPRVALEVIRGRLARLLSDPASFTLPGVLSVGTGDNIRALQAQTDRLVAAVSSEDAAAVPAPEPTRLVRHGVWR